MGKRKEQSETNTVKRLEFRLKLTDKTWSSNSISYPMSQLNSNLPDSPHRHLERATDSDSISINHFISLAVAEKLTTLQTYDLIAERTRGSSHGAFLQAMVPVSAGPVIEGDEFR